MQPDTTTAPATTEADTLRAALVEAQAGLEFAAARLPAQAGDFVPAHLAALKIVNAALASAAQPAGEAEDTLVEYAMQIAHERELDVLGHEHDSEGALQRFRSAVARFAAAPKAAPAPSVTYTELPDFDTVEQRIYAGCRRFISGDMLEPIHGFIREAIDADRASRGQAPAPAEAPTDGQAMGRTRDLAEQGGRWPSDWVEAYRRGWVDAAPTTQAAPAERPAGRVCSANCEYATVQWLQQTSGKGGGDPKNAWSWPIAGDAVYLAQPAPKTAPAAQGDSELLDWLRDNSCDLRCISVRTGGDDSDIDWVVIEHFMAKPQEREIGRAYTDDPRAAILAARAAKEGDKP